MKTIKKTVLFLLLTSSIFNAFAQKAEEVTKKETWQYIKLSYAKGFKTYGLNNAMIKDQNFTSVLAAEVNIYKEHGFYAEFINQPMMRLNSENIPKEIDFFFFSSYYDAYIRSRGFNIGYAYTHKATPKLDLGVRAGVGKTYAEYREYLTDTETLAVRSYEGNDTLTNISLGVLANYSLPNNLGVFGELAISWNSPVFKLGLTYKLD